MLLIWHEKIGNMFVCTMKNEIICIMMKLVTIEKNGTKNWDDTIIIKKNYYNNHVIIRVKFTSIFKLSIAIPISIVPMYHNHSTLYYLIFILRYHPERERERPIEGRRERRNVDLSNWEWSR